MRIRVGCEFDLESEGQVPVLMVVEPRPGPTHRMVAATREVQPAVPVNDYRDAFGNHCWRLVMPGGRIVLRYDALVEVPGRPDPIPVDRPLVPVAQLPDS